jgi:hypothetical protein
MTRLNWKNLKAGRCPKCNCTLVHDPEKQIRHCETKGLAKPYDCGFAITDKRFDEIRAGDVPVQDNQAALNNL